MNYWLLKTEPETYGWSDLEKKVVDKWDGVRSYAARKHLMSMEKGDQVLFYHSGRKPEIVGVAEVVKTFYQDPADTTNKWVNVDIALKYKLQKSVTLSQIKQLAFFKEMVLVKNTRLSVQPVAEQYFHEIIRLSQAI